uniref:Uncharacterized protein n=1 Tax=Cajanus cajan TaxID=3821 RepID=A0A151TGY9_CAJCA|nr:hypothetical protein KK1_012609 [Cajanus cajan]
MANVGTFQNSVISKLLIHPFVWRVTGFGSSIVGFSCYAFSPSFAYFFGKWSTLKIVVYSVVSSLLCMSTLFVKRCSVGHGKCLLLKAQVSFLVLALTSLWSFWEDCHEVQGKVKKGHGKLMNLTSSGAFSLMAMSLSRQLQLGFEVGATNFLVGCFLVTIMKMNLKLAPIAALFCYLLVNIRSISDFLHEKRARDATATQHADAVNVQDREANSIIVSARDTHEASSQDPESCSDDVFKHHGDDTVVSGEIFTKKESAESEGEESFRSGEILALVLRNFIMNDIWSFLFSKNLE